MSHQFFVLLRRPRTRHVRRVSGPGAETPLSAHVRWRTPTEHGGASRPRGRAAARRSEPRGCAPVSRARVKGLHALRRPARAASLWPTRTETSRSSAQCAPHVARGLRRRPRAAPAHEPREIVCQRRGAARPSSPSASRLARADSRRAWRGPTQVACALSGVLCHGVARGPRSRAWPRDHGREGPSGLRRLDGSSRMSTICPGR